MNFFENLIKIIKMFSFNVYTRVVTPNSTNLMHPTSLFNIFFQSLCERSNVILSPCKDKLLFAVLSVLSGWQESRGYTLCV